VEDLSEIVQEEKEEIWMNKNIINAPLGGWLKKERRIVSTQTLREIPSYTEEITKRASRFFLQTNFI